VCYCPGQPEEVNSLPGQPEAGGFAGLAQCQVALGSRLSRLGFTVSGLGLGLGLRV